MIAEAWESTPLPLPATLLLVGAVGTLLILMAAWIRLKRLEPGSCPARDLVFPAMVLAGLALPMARGLIGVARQSFEILRKSPTWELALQCCYLALLAVVVLAVARGTLWQRVSTRRFLTVALGAALLVRLGYIWLVEVEAWSDFALMWDLAGEAARNGPPATPTLFTDRMWPYFFPLSLLFGPSPWVYQISNVLVHLGSGCLTFLLARRWFGEPVARASLLIVLTAPETFCNSVIPTHDIPGVFFLLIALLLLDTGLSAGQHQRWGRAMVAGLGLGLVLVLLDLQRQMGLFWFATVFLYLCLRGLARLSWPAGPQFNRAMLSRAGLTTVAIFLLPLAVSQSGIRALQAGGIIRSSLDRTTFEATWLAANTDSWSDGSYAHAQQNYYGPYENLLTTEDWRNLAIDKFLWDTAYDPIGRVKNFLRKSAQLYNLGAQFYFYFPPEQLLPDSGLTEGSLRRRIADHNTFFVTLFESAFLLSVVVLLFWTGMPARAWPALLLLSSMSGALILFGEVQPRYIYPLWVIAPPIICLFLSKATVFASGFTNSELRKGLTRAASSFLLLILGSWLAFGAVRAAVSTTRTPYLDFGRWNEGKAMPGQCSETDLERKQRPSPQGRFRMVLGCPSSSPDDYNVSASQCYRVNDPAPRDFKVYVYCDSPAPLPLNFVVAARANGESATSILISEANAARQLDLKGILPRADLISLELSVSPEHPMTSGAEMPRFFFEFGRLLKAEVPGQPK